MITEAAINVACETARFFLKLKQKGVIQGKVYQRNGKAAHQVALWLYDHKREKHCGCCTTSWAGSFVFGEVPPGHYRIDLRSGGYQFTDMEKLYLSPGQDVVLRVDLPVNCLDRTEKLKDEDVSLDIIADTGPLQIKHENYKDYIFPQIGQEYVLRVKNESANKLLAVVTVDGLSVMNGEPGDLYSAGYVLEPFRRIDIPGWRLNDSEVAKFVFLRKNQSYAELTNRPTNIGVIACAFFEQKDLSRILESQSILESQAFGSGESPGIGSGESPAIGTGFGKKVQHEVTRVEFERENAPSIIKTIYYLGSEQAAKSKSFDPNPFPGCKPPPGWEG